MHHYHKWLISFVLSEKLGLTNFKIVEDGEIRIYDAIVSADCLNTYITDFHRPLCLSRLLQAGRNAAGPQKHSAYEGLQRFTSRRPA